MNPTSLLRKKRSVSGGKDDGFAIAMVSLLLIPLIGFMALAIDVGSWYTQATRVQRAVDAAALSSVVWMPNLANAETVAIETMAKHGIDFTETFEHPTNGPMPRWDLTVEPVPSNSFQVRVVLADNNAPIYFGGLFVDNVEITRQAIAEFVKPIPMGSRSNGIGVQCDARDVTQGNPGGDNECDNVPQGGFFLEAFGPATHHANGDAFLSKCLWGSFNTGSGSCGTDNPNYESLGKDGFTFAVDVPTPNTTVTVQLFDPWHTNRGTIDGLPRDANWGGGPISTKFTVYEADGSNLTTDVITPVSGCETTYEGQPAGTTDGVHPGPLTWITLCTFTAVHADIYPIRVQTSNFPGASEDSNGFNAYSMRAFFGSPLGGPNGAEQHYNDPTGVQPRVYALDWLPIESHANISRFDLAEIGPEHAGKTLALKLFDAGDGQGDISLKLDTPFGPAQDCRLREWQDPDTPPEIGPVRPGLCEIETTIGGASQYQDTWFEIQVPIPVNYTCTVCWWTVDFDATGGDFNEVTNWGVSILGDPVRLVG